MIYIGKGFLIGFKTYEKDGITKYVYNVLNGTKDSENGLYTECEYITIIQEEQTLKEIKPQPVTFELVNQNFGGKIQQRFINIKGVN